MFFLRAPKRQKLDFLNYECMGMDKATRALLSTLYVFSNVTSQDTLVGMWGAHSALNNILSVSNWPDTHQMVVVLLWEKSPPPVLLKKHAYIFREHLIIM